MDGSRVPQRLDPCGLHTEKEREARLRKDIRFTARDASDACSACSSCCAGTLASVRNEAGH